MCGVRGVCALGDVKKVCALHISFCYRCINDMFVRNRDSNVQGADKSVCITVNFGYLCKLVIYVTDYVLLCIKQCCICN